MVKEIIIFASGCVVGAAVAVPITKRKVSKREKDLEMMNESKDDYIAELENKIKLDELSLSAGYIKKEEEYEEIKPKKVILTPPKRDYTVYFQEKAESEYPMEEYREEIRENERIHDSMTSGKPPKVVSYEEYWSPEYEYHDKCELNYFTEDEILASPENEEIEDVFGLIGDTIQRSGFNRNDEKVIYVRNYELSRDYEIAKVFGAYADTV